MPLKMETLKFSQIEEPSLLICLHVIILTLLSYFLAYAIPTSYILLNLHRYSLPVNFQAVVMKPHRKAQKKLTETLNQLYGHLDAKFIASEIEVSWTPKH